MSINCNGGVSFSGKINLEKLIITPVADFSGTPLTGTAPYTVTFTDLSLNEPTSWLWDFKNDGTATSTLQNPTYNYTVAGIYSVKLTATNSAGSDIIVKTAYVTVDAPPSGQQTFTTLGSQSFIVPAGVSSISGVVVGGGGGGDYSGSGVGGGGGALAYANNISVTPGETITVFVGTGGIGGTSGGNASTNGGESYIRRGASTYLVRAGGGARGLIRTGGTVIVGTGGSGGAGGSAGYNATGGGGAGGYSGNGGKGGGQDGNSIAGSGGGGGGGGYANTSTYGGGGGGGVGLLGTGTNGTAGSNGSGGGGGGGSGGNSGVGFVASHGGAGGTYGAGGGGRSATSVGWTGGAGAQGAVRIIWGTGRSYPSNAT